jgi:uncharacterized surface protein with fasciclin (FAS1) repeats
MRFRPTSIAATAAAAALVIGASACSSDDDATLNTLGSEVSALATSEITVDSSMASSLGTTLDSVLDSIPSGTDVADRLDTASEALRNGDFSTMLSALQLSGLGAEIEDRAVTLLAPNDTAFRDLSSGQLSDLLTNPRQIDDLLRRHVLDGVYTLDQLRSMTSVETIGGETLTVAVSGSTVTIDGAELREVSMGSSGTTTTTGGSTSGSGRELMVFQIDKVLLAD